jgi:hypothetical protein
MTCREARRRLSDYLDASLKARTLDELARHLDVCPDCREEYRLLAATRHLVSTYGASPCPVDFSYLATRVPLRIQPDRWWSYCWHNAGFLRCLAIAGAALVVTVGGWQWRNLAAKPPWPDTTPPRIVIRDVADVDELHRSFAVQHSMGARDGLVLYAPQWVDRGR